MDFLRCSVVCDDPATLDAVINTFIDLINSGKGDSILKIVRIKNGFKNVSSKMSIEEFNYADIKMNLLIEYNDKRIIGEIQFLLKFMLNAKKIGHSYYSFYRKKEYYEKLDKINNSLMNNHNVIENVLKTQILSQNKNVFSKILHLLMKNEKLHLIKNSNILKKLQQSQWKKGEAIFQSICNA